MDPPRPSHHGRGSTPANNPVAASNTNKPTTNKTAHRPRFNPYPKRIASTSSAPRVKTCAFPLPTAAVSIAQLDDILWLQYFPNDTNTAGSALDTKLRALQSFVERQRHRFDLAAIRSTHICPLAVETFHTDAALQKAWPTFDADLSENPRQTLRCIELTVHKQTIRLPATGRHATVTARINACLRRVRLRLDGCGPLVSLRSLRVYNYGRLVTIRGTVIRAGAVQLLCAWLAFQCPACGAEQVVRQPDGRTVTPTACRTAECRTQSGFVPLLGSPHTRTEALQSIRLQESMQGMQFESGQVPRTIELEFACDLVDVACPGDDVMVTGVLQVHADGSEGAAAAAAAGGGGGGGGNASGWRGGGNGAGQSKDAATMHHLYVDAVSVACDKNMQVRLSEFSAQDLEVIAKVREEPSVLRLLVHSLCPGIYGHDMVKAGLLLGLFGGTGHRPPLPAAGPKPSAAVSMSPAAATSTLTAAKNATTGDNTAATTAAITSASRKRRCEAHILVVGDPGIGKSQMLQACAAVSPRGVFVCGNSSSSAGLTVAVRNERGGGSSLEAGALVLADQGCCCIDEFDKMAANHAALLEVMEEQTVSVAKAGVLCSLPARTCILAAANPSGGHYNHDRTLVDNLKLNPALLSRFDLVFVLLDRPDEHTDRLMSAHITETYGIGRPPQPTTGRTSTRQPLLDQNTQNTQADELNRTLWSRLRLRMNECIDALPHELMQKYIGYARKNVYPALTAEAAAVLKAFYLEQRSERRGANSTPVTTRQLEALIRLTQARARCDLSERATVEHALDVLDIVRHSMAAVERNADGGQHGSAGGSWLNGRGQRAASGKPLSQAVQLKRLLAALQQRSAYENRTVYTLDEIRETADAEQGVGGVAGGIGQLVDALNMQGVLLKKGQGMFKLLLGGE